MTVDGSDAANAASKGSSPKNLATLEILLNLLQARGLNDTASCLQREAGVGQPPGSRGNSPGGGSAARKGDANISELVAPATEEALRLRSHAASLAQAEQRRRIASLAQEMSKQGQQMSEVRDLVHRVRNAASSVHRPSLEEQEEQIKKNDLELRELEVICSERDALGRKLRVELDRASSEVSELRRTLEEREDEETKARMQLTRLEEEALKLSCELEAVPVATQARKIQALLAAWHDHDGHLQVMVRQLFFDMDRDKDGRLEWNNSEIRDFVRELFHRNGILLPNWQEHVWYEMYRRADVNGAYSLELDEAMRFARSCFEAALALVLTGQSENGTDPTAQGEQWARTHMAQAVPVARSAMTYSSGVVIDFLDHSQTFHPVITANTSHRVRMVRLIESGEHLKATMRTYRDCDKDGNGRLTWNNGEIRDFITACFRQHGLSPPNQEQMFAMYSQFDKDKNNALDMRECLEMVDALFRSCFVLESASNGGVGVTTSQPARVLRAPSPGASQPRIAQVRGVSPSQPRAETLGFAATIPSTIRSVSPGQRQQFVTVSPRTAQQSLFDKIDTNHDGSISRGELENALRSGAVGGGSQFGTMVTGASARAPSPGGTFFVQGGSMRSGNFPVGVPQGVGSAGGMVGSVRRMHSGGYSPANPPIGATILTTASPRGSQFRATSQDGSVPGTVVITGGAYQRTASPMHTGGIVSPANSQAGSHVGGAPHFVSQNQLGRSASNEQLQVGSAAQRVSSARLRMGMAADVGPGQRQTLPVTRVSPRNPPAVATVLRTQPAAPRFA